MICNRFSVYFVCKIELNLLVIFQEILVKVRIMRHGFPFVISVHGTESFALLNTKIKTIRLLIYTNYFNDKGLKKRYFIFFCFNVCYGIIRR